MKYGFFALLISLALCTKVYAEDIYLFYNASSDNLDELEIKHKEVAEIYDGEFGTAEEELPREVRYDDFYVAKYPDKSFVFILKAPFNCGALGCGTLVYERDEDGDLIAKDSKTPVNVKSMTLISSYVSMEAINLKFQRSLRKKYYIFQLL